MLQLLNIARGRESEFAIAALSICVSRVRFENSDVFVGLGQMKVCIFALQETRLRRMSPQFEEYLIYKGDATPQGHHGVLAAISTTIPYGYYMNGQGRAMQALFHQA